MEAWLDQYCINVTDLERSVALFEVFGLQDIVRTPLSEAKIDEAIVGNPAKGGRIQLAVWHERSGPIDHGNALWKQYVYTNDIERIYADAIAFGCEAVTPPFRTERWPTSIAFVKDPDGYLIEFVQRHNGAGDDLTTRAWVGQYCINVTEIEATIAFYETLGMTVQSRTEIDQASEAILQHAGGKGGKVQLAQQKEPIGPIDMGTAVWKLYVYTDDCAGAHDALVEAGYESIAAPKQTERWPTIIAFVSDPDGYAVELVEWSDRTAPH